MEFVNIGKSLFRVLSLEREFIFPLFIFILFFYLCILFILEQRAMVKENPRDLMKYFNHFQSFIENSAYIVQF